MSDKNRDYPIQPIPFTSARIEDEFWRPRIDTAVNITIPYDFEKCEETGRIDNFAKAGGLMEGAHQGIFYNDSDVFRWSRALHTPCKSRPTQNWKPSLTTSLTCSPARRKMTATLHRGTIDPGQVPEACGPARWSNLAINHELYNVGHCLKPPSPTLKRRASGSFWISP